LVEVIMNAKERTELPGGGELGSAGARGRCGWRTTEAQRTRRGCFERSRRRRGFSLIEVNMALLVVGIGLSALLGLFPAALRESGLATADTAQAMFADQVLNMLHANAASITNWSAWNSGFGGFITNTTAEVTDDARVPVQGGTYHTLIGDGVSHTIDNYLVAHNSIEYRLTFERSGSRVRAWLRVAERKSTDITKNPIYATEFIFMGM
jgi:prepilin-type N-terminal cleavage/methylation domain-containing protein